MPRGRPVNSLFARLATMEKSLPANPSAVAQSRRGLRVPGVRTGLVMGVLALNLLVGLLAVSTLQDMRHMAQERAATATGNLAQLLDRDITATLDRMAVALGAVARHLDGQAAGPGINRRTLARFVHEELAVAEEAGTIDVFDAQGAQVCTGLAGPCPRLSIAGSDCFKHAQSQHNLRPQLFGPARAQAQAPWSLLLCRTLLNADKTFAGVAVAWVPLSSIKAQFAQLDLGRQGAVSLRTESLTLLARHPGPMRMPTEAENRRVSAQLLAAVAQQAQGGAYRAATAIDGIERENAYRKLDRYPLYIIVGLGTADFMVGWRRDATQAAVISLLFLGATVGMALWVLSSLRRREAGEVQLRGILESVAEGIVFHAQDGAIVEANGAAERILGLSKDQLLGRSSLDPRWHAVREDGTPLPGELHPAMVTLRTGQAALGQLMGVQDPVRGLRWISVNTQALPVLAGATGRAVVASFTDITERRQVEARLREREALFRSLFEQSLFLAGVLDDKGAVLELNPHALRTGGLVAEQVRGLPFRSLPFWSASPDIERLDAALRAAAQGVAGSFETRHVLADGSAVDVIFNAMPVGGPKGRRIAVVGVDITERKRVEAQLKTMNKDFETLLGSTSDFIYFKDRQSRFRFCSQTLARLTGHQHWRDMIGKHDVEVFPPAMAQIYQHEEAPVLEHGEPLPARVDPYVDEAGTPGWVSTKKWPVFGDDGKTVVGLFGISRIVTEQKRQEDELRKMAVTDSLTGVATRREFIAKLSHELARLRRDPTQVCSLLMLDLDHFKCINDDHGHAVGDAVLRHVTRLVGLEVREADSVGRLGGEEFGILLPGSDAADAMVFAERLRQKIQATPLDCETAGEAILARVVPAAATITISTTASIGVTELCAADRAPEQPLARADTAMYQAKHHGRNRVLAWPC
jgi:diguanylate cyclase (GGDEF)-like protein/PAS domain S-box-containing protein